MLLNLLLLLTLVPMLELMVLLQVHHALASALGSGMALVLTLGMIVFTGCAGAILARQQGFSVLRGLQASMGRGELPQDALINGAMILVGAALLLTPGFLTDILGFSLLIPISRDWHRRWMRAWLKHKVERGDVNVFVVQSEVRPSETVEPESEHSRLSH